MLSEKPRRRGRAPQTVAGLSALAQQGLTLLRVPHALRWRLETFGLYMPSLPKARPWWRVNLRALYAFTRQLPGYARWLADFAALRRQGATGWWQTRTTTNIKDWEAWLDQSC